MPNSAVENSNHRRRSSCSLDAVNFGIDSANNGGISKPKTRSRNGCSTCKAKRLKCDETKPECLVCINNRRKCLGYNQSFRWSTKYEKSLTGKGAKGPSNLNDLVTATSNTVIAHNPHPRQQNAHDLDEGPASPPAPPPPPPPPSSAPKVSEVTSESFIVLDPCSSLTSRMDGDLCLEADLLHVSTHGVLTPNLESLILPDFEYGIEDLLQDIRCPEDIPHRNGGSPNPDDTLSEGQGVVDHEVFFGPCPQDQVLSLEAPPRVWSPFPSWTQGFPTPPQEEAFRRMPRTLHDRTTMLVEEWFRNVCPMWSSYDSEMNLNRKLAQETWSRSEAVMNCLQGMSATCLSVQMPHMKKIAVSTLKNAILAIHKGIKIAFQGNSITRFPADLFLAICCVGTAACWIDTTDLGMHFLKEAKALLLRINREAGRLPPQDRQMLSFFNKSLVHWNMVAAVVSDEPDDLVVPKLEDIPNKGEVVGQIVPHPWTGVSVEAQRSFGQAIKLCRRFRRHLRRASISTMRNLQTALNDIKEAQEIEEELLALEHYSMYEISDTGDRMTPKAHLVAVAEGYRLASLLQLYQTFPDLVARRMPEHAEKGGQVPWNSWITPLSLQLVSILKKIPPTSGTRCIQPLLYISASTGLRFDVETFSEHQNPMVVELQAWCEGDGVNGVRGRPGQPNFRSDEVSSSPTFDVDSGDFPFEMVFENTSSSGNSASSSSGGAASSNTNKSSNQNHVRRSTSPKTGSSHGGDNGEVDPEVLKTPFTRMSIDISHARRFVLERLSALEHTLPPAPVKVARELVRAIWAGYDAEKPGSNYTHWIDVMEESGLRTIFG